MKYRALFIVLCFYALPARSQAVFQSSGAGTSNWNDPATWTLVSGTTSTGYPGSGDTATIGSAATLTVDTIVQCSALTINGGATLQFNSVLSILTVSNSLSMTAAANLNLSLGVLTVTGSMTIGGASTVTVSQGALSVIGLLLLNAPTTSTGNSLIDVEGGAFTCAGGMTVTATTMTRTAELRINAGAVTLAGAVAVLSANAHINFTGPGTMTVAGSIDIPNTASFTAGNGRVIYFGIPGTNQTIAPLTYYRLVITGAGAGDKQISGAVNVTDTLALLTDTLLINSGGSLTLSDGITIVRNAGHIGSAPTFAGSANLVYNDVGLDTTGPEMPVATTTLQNLTIGDFGGIALGANVTVNNNINLILGPLVTGSYTLTLANPAGGVSTDPGITRTNGYIVGPLVRDIGTSTGLRTFPLAAVTDQVYREFDLNYTTAPTAAGTITAIAEDTAAPAQSGLPLNDNGEIVVNVAALYWQADAGAGLTGGAYTLSVTATNAPGVDDLSTLRIIKRPSTGGPWIADGTAGTNSGTTSVPIIVRTGMSGFSQFAIGSDGSNTLPIDLQSFTAQLSGTTVLLTWVISSTFPTQSFIIAHSTDGNHFTALATIPADSGLTQTYTQSPAPAGINYYRLTLIAPGSDSTYSPIINVNVGSTAASWSLYPNPATSTVTIQSATAATAATPSAAAAPSAAATPSAGAAIAGTTTAAPFLLYDAQGKFLRTLAVGANDISTLVPGMYVVRSQEKTMIFMKQ